MKRRRTYPPPALAPTGYGLAAAVLGGALFLLAAQTGSTSCMAGALAILLAHAASLAVAVAARLDFKRNGPADTPSSRDALRMLSLLAADRRARVTYDRIDQAQRVVATCSLDHPPSDRGAYRARQLLFTATGPLWLWNSSVALDLDQELLIPPAPMDTPVDLRTPPAASDAGGHVNSEFDTTLVRPYQPGDPMRSIAWRQTAHHGGLMSFERRRTAHANVLVVPDIEAARTPSDADALAARTASAWHHLKRRHSDSLVMRIVLDDGELRVDDDPGANRYCAALYPSREGRGPSSSTAVAAPAATAATASSAAPAAPVADRTQRVLDAARDLKAGSVVFITTNDESPLAQTLAASDLAPRVACIDAAHLSTEATCGDDAATQHDADEKAGDASAPASNRAPLERGLRGLLCGVAMFYPLWILLQAMSTMFSTGKWRYVALYALVLICAEAALLEALRDGRVKGRGSLRGSRPGWHRGSPDGRHRGLRGGVNAVCVARACILVFTTVALFALGAVVSRQIISNNASFALYKHIYEQPVALGALEIAGPVARAVNILTVGVNSLYYGQWIPVRVGFAGDAALAILWCVAAMAMRPLLLSRRARPLAAAMPLIAQAVAFQCMGESPSLPHVGVAIACGLALAALSHDPRGGFPLHPPIRSHPQPNVCKRRRRNLRARTGRIPGALANGALVCTIALVATAFSPAATDAVPAAPFDLVPRHGTFSSGAVNPVLDLKRDLVRTGKSTALTYQAVIAGTGVEIDSSQSYGPLYLRLTTLESFNSDTWLARKSSTSGLGASMVDTPPALSNLARLERLNSAALGEVATVAATVTIQHSASPHLPVPENPLSAWPSSNAVDTARRNRNRAADALDGLAWSDDGGAGTRDGANIPRGFSYSVLSAYQAPYTDPRQLDRLESIARRINEHIDALEQPDAHARTPMQPDNSYLNVGEPLPDAILAIVASARTDGVAEIPSAKDPANLSPGANGLTPRQSAQIESMRYLVDLFANGGFSYSLDAPDGDGANNLQVIADLLETRQGYCVHYASALAVLGRALGVPTRLVLGYRANAEGLETAPGGEGAEVVTYRATNHDLHAWTEAYIDNVGWISFDVTPSAGQSEPPVVPSGNADSAPGIDHADGKADPDDAVDREPSGTADAGGMGFAGEEEGEGKGAADAASALSSLSRAIESLVTHAAKALPVVCGGTALLVAAFSPRLLRRARRARRMRSVKQAARDPERAVRSAWSETIDSALDAGMTWRRSDTEEEISAAIAWTLSQGDHDPLVLNALDSLRLAVCAVRYSDGGDAIAGLRQDELISQFNTLLAEIDAHARRASSDKGAIVRAGRFLVPSSIFAQRHLRQR